MDFAAFARERDAAFLSLDRAKILAYCRKYGIPAPDIDEVFFAGVHKAILQIRSATEAEKERSRQWLAQHGFKVPANS